MLCGLVGSPPTVTAMLALSVDPPLVGVNVTATVQLDFGDAVAHIDSGADVTNHRIAAVQRLWIG